MLLHRHPAERAGVGHLPTRDNALDPRTKLPLPMHPWHERRQGSAILSFRARLGLYYDLPDHMLRFVESTYVAVGARRPECLFISLAWVEKP
jgi:hypothetical protein